MIESDGHTNYPLIDNSSVEAHRLDMQYMLTKKMFGYGNILDVPFDKDNVSYVLDVGAGSGSWILDVARIPEINVRLSPSSSNPIQLYMSDITTAKFPPSSVLDPLNISTFEQDVTKQFPDWMQDKFDVVHMSTLVWALTQEGWILALKNIYSALKPGGCFILLDGDVVFKADETLIEDPYDPDVLSIGRSLASKLNSIFLINAIHTKRVPKLSSKLRGMLEDASFKITSSRISHFPVGGSSSRVRAPSGENLGEFADVTALGIKIFADALSQQMLAEGRLEVPRGSKITSEQDRRKIVDEIYQGVREEGLFGLASEWISWKGE